MKRSAWLRIIAVILIISMVAAPVSAAGPKGSTGTRNHLIGNIADMIRDLFRDRFGGSFGQPGEEPTTPSNPVDPTTPTEPGETEPEESEPEISLELIEGHANVENGHLLRGVTYSLTEVLAAQSNPPFSLRNNGFGATSLGGNTAGSLSLGRVPLNALAEGDTTAVSAKIEGITGNGSSVDTSEPAFNKSVGNAFDGDYSTFWATVPGGTLADCYLIADLGDEYTIDKVQYTKRIFNGSYDCTGNLLNYIIEVSTDGATWTQVASGTTVNGTTEITFNAVPATHVRLTSTSSYHWQAANANTVMTCAEFEVFGYVETTEPEQPVEPEEPDPEQPVAPEEPEQPAIGSELVYFPVTMFNYNNGISELNEDAIMRTLTHQAEVEAGLKEKWEGLYFSGGNPASTSHTYTTEAASHSDLSWQQVIDGTYYAEEACTNRVAVNTIGDASSEYTLTTVAVGDIWNSRGNEVNVANVNTFETNYYCLYNNNYYHAYIRNSGNSYYVQYLRNGILYGAGNNGGYVFGISDTLSLYENNASVTGYTLVAGGNTLATLDGTDLTAKVGVTLYTAASEVTVEKDYAEWNFWAYKTSGNAAQNKFYAGLVQDELVDGELKFNVVEPGIFTFDASDPTITNDGIKDIYQNVGLPFIKNEKGYYTFKSDAHGTYFADTNNDNKSDPWYGAEDDYFNMYFDYNQTQGWSGMDYGDGSTNLWAPFNTNANDTAEGYIDYHFGMRADIPFSMTPNGCIKSNDDNSEHITFTFQGDDDVWIFIDGHLVIDLGGIHNRLGATIDFADNTITYFQPESNPSAPEFGAFNIENFELVQKLYNDANGEGALGQTRTDFSTVVDHEMSIFYLERGKGTSNCQIEFNLPMLDTVLVTKEITHSWSAAADELDGDNGDGTEKLTAREQAAVDKLDFDFKLWKKEIGGRYTAVANTNYYLLDKDDNVLGIYTTGADGIFSLKNGQTAMFLTDLGNGTITYAVEELNLDLDTFLTPDYKFAGLTTNGFDFYGETLNTETPDENDTKRVDKHLTGNASEIGEQELPMDAVQLVSYDVTPYGSIEAIESLEFICTNYLNAELPNPTACAYEDIIVIDYGLPVQIDPLANDLFRGENIEIVAWGDETLELNGAFVGQLGSNANYDGDKIDLTDCLYTFTEGENDRWSAAAMDGSVYLYPGNSRSAGYPNRTEAYANLSIDEGYEQGTFYIYSNDSEGNGNTSYLYFDRSARNLNRVDNPGNNETWKTNCSVMLYKPVDTSDSSEIPGYERVTELDDVTDGEYLIVAPGNDGNLYALYPNTATTNTFCQIAKLVPIACANAAAFDSGNVTFNDVTYAETANADGTITFTRDSFEYELTEQMTEVEEIRYIIKVNSTVEEEIGDEIVTKTACRYALGKVYIVPATIMYYEENFSDMITFEGDGWHTSSTVSNQSNVDDFQEPGVVGTVGDSTYGSDVAYLNDNGDSNGTHRRGDTTNGAIRFTYTFTGTGTSIFARTSAKTGYMQVKIYEGTDTTGKYRDIYYRDTYYEDTNGTELDSDGILYNIPVYTQEDLPYGTYTVVCTVAKKGTLNAGPVVEEGGVLVKRSGGEFYLDGIRVLQPLNEGADVELVDKALEAYATDGEANLDVVTLRYKLITDVTDDKVQWDGENFVVLTDTIGAIKTAADYESFGPKEEVYLAPGQKVSFSLKYWQPEGLKLYMGMKAPFGSAKVNIGHNAYELNNAPDCYYDVTEDYASLNTKTDADGNEYYVVTYTFEAAESIVSLTNIKVVGNYEFTIIENDDIDSSGDNGEGEDTDIDITDPEGDGEDNTNP